MINNIKPFNFYIMIRSCRTCFGISESGNRILLTSLLTGRSWNEFRMTLIMCAFCTLILKKNYWIVISLAGFGFTSSLLGRVIQRMPSQYLAAIWSPSTNVSGTVKLLWND